MIDLIQKKIDKSKEIIYKMLSLCQNPYIALSFGKDSLIMMDLIYTIQPNLTCIFLKSEESFLMYNYEEVIKTYLQSHQLNLHIIDTKRLTENDFDWEKARKQGNKDFFLEDFDKYDGVFMGLRIEESKERRISIIKKENNQVGHRIMKYKTGSRANKYRACPLADWKLIDIDIYIEEKGLKMLDVYEKFGSKQRTTARITGDAVRQNTLFWIKRTKPENWNKLVTMLPEFRTMI